MFDAEEATVPTFTCSSHFTELKFRRFYFGKKLGWFLNCFLLCVNFLVLRFLLFKLTRC